MKYCSNCGNRVKTAIPDGDDKVRFVCQGCETIHYENPKMVAGTLPEWKDKILLCRRAIHPARGKWTLPAGFLENGETVSECALRETREEACATLIDLRPYAMIDLPFIHQVYFMFRGKLLDGTFSPGPESLETKLFYPDELPWDKIAFGSIRSVLEKYCTDIKASTFPFQILNHQHEKPG